MSFFACKNMSYWIAEDLKVIAEKVIKEHKELYYVSEFDIAYMWCDKSKKKHGSVVYGECRKVTEQYQALVGYDYIITFFVEACDELSDKALELLMWHELSHTEEDGGITPHDVQDFRKIIDEYGIDWIHL